MDTPTLIVVHRRGWFSRDSLADQIRYTPSFMKQALARLARRETKRPCI